MPGLFNLRPFYAASKAARVSKPSSTPPLRQVFPEQFGQAFARVGAEGATSGQQATYKSELHAQKTSATAMGLAFAQEYGPANLPDASGKTAVEIASNSSGSMHDPSSTCLEVMVSDFIEESDAERMQTNAVQLQPLRKHTDATQCPTCGSCRCEAGACKNDVLMMDDDEHEGYRISELVHSIENLASPTNVVESQIFLEVTTCLKSLTVASDGCQSLALGVEHPGQASASITRRAVMGHLRNQGFDAAVCKSRWEHSRGFPGGAYEYIDVVFPGDDMRLERIIVDIDFQSQFRVARPTDEFDLCVRVTPAVFVGRQDSLLQLVDILSDEARRSLRTQGMHIPPWRRMEYLKAKWVSPYKRTINEQPSSSPINPAAVNTSPHCTVAPRPASPTWPCHTASSARRMSSKLPEKATPAVCAAVHPPAHGADLNLGVTVLPMHQPVEPDVVMYNGQLFSAKGFPTFTGGAGIGDFPPQPLPVDRPQKQKSNVVSQLRQQMQQYAMIHGEVLRHQQQC